jgi:cell division protease FtsH
MMGGRCAEEIIFDQRTTGAGNDIEQATDLARKMVTEWGMSEEIGPLNFSSGGQEVFLGREFSQGESYSEATAMKLDGEIRRIVTEQYQRALSLLEQHRAVLESIAETLLEHETLSGAEIKTLFEGGEVVRPTDNSSAEDDSANQGESSTSKPKRPALFPPIGKKEPDPEPV